VEDPDWLAQLAPAPSGEPTEEDAEPKVEREYAVEVSGRRFDVKVIGAAGGPVDGAAPATPKRRREKRKGIAEEGEPGELVSPLQGTVLSVAVEQGDQIEKGTLVCVIEAMKMENELAAPASGTVEELNVSAGAPISAGDTIAVIK
jgi:acetyl-CoA/propionyl-CoA carboxylase biotin carboxyl carrier protein